MGIMSSTRSRTFIDPSEPAKIMPCEHLQELFELCEKHDLQIASQDAIKVVCRQCQQQEVCPSSLTDGEQVIELSRPVAPSTEPNDSSNAAT